MSIAEREREIETAASPLDDAPSTLASALAPLRGRMLLRVFLRWYWIGALALDALVLAALLIAKPALSDARRIGLDISLLAVPFVVAGVRSLAVRLPLSRLAQLVDQRGGLQDCVASAIEVSASRLASPRMLSLLTRDALIALRAIDAPRLLPIKRDAFLAAFALAATFAFWFWHAPEVIGFALNGKSAPPNAVDEFTGERHLASVRSNSGQPATSPPPTAMPQSKQPSETAPQPKSSPQKNAPAAARSQPSGTADQHGDNAPSASGKQQSSSGKPAGASKNSHSTGGKQGANGASRASASPQAAPGNQFQPQPNSQTGSGQKRPGKSGQGGSAGKSSQSPAQRNARSTSQSAGKQPNNGGHPGQSQKQGQPSGRKQAQGQGDLPSRQPGAQPNQHSSSSASGGKSDASDQNRNLLSRPSHPDSPFATGGHGKPLPIQPRSLAPIANRSRFSFRLPRPTDSALKEMPANAPPKLIRPGQNGGSGSTVPFGTGQAATGSIQDSADPSEVEQNPRIPAAYRNLVKQYFGSGTGHAH